jgi:hypothetical protein
MVCVVHNQQHMRANFAKCLKLPIYYYSIKRGSFIAIVLIGNFLMAYVVGPLFVGFISIWKSFFGEVSVQILPFKKLDHLFSHC